MKKILVFIPDNYADWESAYICSELNKTETDCEVKTIAINNSPVKSMGGFNVIPDYTISTAPDNFEFLILVGGTTWMKGENDSVKTLIDLCVSKNIPIAAICDACTFLADKGYLDHIEHTGNSVEYLKQLAPHYKGEKYFIQRQVIVNDRFITANGSAAVEFAKAILNHLDVMSQDSLEKWYKMFKVGFYKD